MTPGPNYDQRQLCVTNAHHEDKLDNIRTPRQMVALSQLRDTTVLHQQHLNLDVLALLVPLLPTYTANTTTGRPSPRMRRPSDSKDNPVLRYGLTSTRFWTVLLGSHDAIFYTARSALSNHRVLYLVTRSCLPITNGVQTLKYLFVSHFFVCDASSSTTATLHCDGPYRMSRRASFQTSSLK